MRSRALVALCPLAASAAVMGSPSASPAATSVTVLVVEGKGFGHGVGMAQDGAFWMGKAGATTNAILGHFYPGTNLGRATGTVKVAVHTGPSQDALLAFPNGGQVRDGESGATTNGFPISVAPGGQVRVWFENGRYFASQPVGAPPRASGVRSDREKPSPAPFFAVRTAGQPIPTTPTTAPRPTTTLLPRPRVIPTTTTAPPPARPATPPSTAPGASPPPPASSARALWAYPAGGGTVEVPARQRRYRGSLETIGAPGALRLVNHIDVEQYLLGMGEVRDPSWPAASLRAQAIVARTYALRAMANSGELCDTQRCQVYLGQQAEYGAMNKAVADTRGRVVVYGLGLASAVYSANGGGVSATPEEGFGTAGARYPYLRATPYTTGDPMPWTVRVALADLAGRFGYKGDVTGARVTKAGPSARALEVALEGTAGPQTVDGARFQAGLGLRSTLFTFRTEQADVAPPAPPAGDVLQAPPDQLAGGGAPPAASASPASAETPAAREARLPRAEPEDRRMAIILSALALAATLSLALTRNGRGAKAPAVTRETG